MQGPIRVLMVCTANQCRSPMMQALLAARVSRMYPGMGWSIESAGVRAELGRPMDPHAETVLAERGIATAGWVSRRLDRSLVEAADLVLAAELDHRRAAVELCPSAVRRSFLFLPFAQMMARVPAILAAAAPRHGPDRASDPARELLATAARGRALLRPEELSTELADPVGHPISWFRACADVITDAVDDILAGVAGPPPNTPDLPR